MTAPSWTYTRSELRAASAAGLELDARLLDAIRWSHGMIDAATAAALAHGIPVAELWLEQNTDRIETRLMRHADGSPAVGEYSRGTCVARVWMEGLELRYEGVKLGAGWVAEGGEA